MSENLHHNSRYLKIFVSLLAVYLLGILMFNPIQAYALANKSPDNQNEISTTKFIISAANSSSADKNISNYICQGTDDQKVIQIAINKLPPEGGIVELRDGTYKLSTQINLLKNNITLQGQGTSTILQSTGNMRMLIRIRETSGIIVQSLYLDGSSQKKGTVGSYVIGTGLATNIIIRNITAMNGGYYGINVWNTSDSIIEDNVVVNSVDDGIHPGSDSFDWGYRNRILNNICYGNDFGIKDRGCSVESAPLGNYYSGNVCYNNREYGILVANQSGSTVENNECYNNGKSGISFTYMSQSSISQNECSGNATLGSGWHDIDVYNSTNIINTNNSLSDLFTPFE